MGWRKRRRASAGDVGEKPPPVEQAAVRVVPVVGELRSGGDESLLATVTAELESSDSGVEFVYRSLDRVKQRTGADEVVVVLEGAPLGRQAFRAGRGPVRGGWAREQVAAAEAGLHAMPGAVDPVVAASIVNLCSLAVRLDVARHESVHDPLTGLLNRRAFDELLASSCSQSARYGWDFALVLIDLNSFKRVNDCLGHRAGDDALRAVAAELRNKLRVGDAAARIGGDEFALVLPNVVDGLLPELVARLEAAIEAAVPAAGVTFSTGCAFAPKDAVDPGELYDIADRRLYEEKAQ